MNSRIALIVLYLLFMLFMLIVAYGGLALLEQIPATKYSLSSRHHSRASNQPAILS